MSTTLKIRPVENSADKKKFVDVVWSIYVDDPYWVPPLKSEVHGLLNEKKNPWFEHGRLQLFLAERGDEVVGRISAHVDDLWLERFPGCGMWGLFEAKDAEAAAALIETAEQWLREQGMARAMGPISLSIWDEPGLLGEGFEEKPMIMMGHHRPE
ncbi:MAG: N-acetyltransferase, partial [Sphingomonadaceae bacterium]